MTRAPHTTRDDDSREESTRAKVWRPADQLPMPDDMPGYKFRWIRLSTLGDPDHRNISVARREGWEFVSSAEMPELAAECGAESAGDMIVFGGLALAKMPIETWKQMRDYYQQKSDNQIVGVNNNLMSEQDPRMPLYREHKSVTNNRPR